MPSWRPTWPNEDFAIERRRFLDAEDEREFGTTELAAEAEDDRIRRMGDNAKPEEPCRD